MPLLGRLAGGSDVGKVAVKGMSRSLVKVGERIRMYH